jgi:hypothetical protein
VFVLAGLALSGYPAAQLQDAITLSVNRSGPQIIDPATGSPIGGAMFNPCTGELVDVAGTLAVRVTEAMAPDGNLATRIRVESLFQGVAQGSGTLYRAKDAQALILHRPPSSLEFETDFAEKINMMGPQRHDDWILRARLRVTVDPFGTPSATLVRFSDDEGCRGRAQGGSGAALPPLPGLVAAYTFDEGSGSAVADATGNGNNGTIRGATFVAGRAGTALRFDGVDDWVTVADSASLDLSTGLTLEAWVKPTADMSGWDTVLMKERGASNMAYALYAHDGAPGIGGVAAPAGYVNVAGSHQAIRGASALAAGGWVHLAVTYNGSRLRFYMNGALIAGRAQTGDVVTSGGALRIGGSGSWANEFFAGLIDDVRIYNRALTPAEIVIDLNTRVR